MIDQERMIEEIHGEGLQTEEHLLKVAEILLQERRLCLLLLNVTCPGHLSHQLKEGHLQPCGMVLVVAGAEVQIHVLEVHP